MGLQEKDKIKIKQKKAQKLGSCERASESDFVGRRRDGGLLLGPHDMLAMGGRAGWMEWPRHPSQWPLPI